MSEAWEFNTISFSFFYDPMDAGNLTSGSSAFSNPAYTSGSPWFTYCWSLASRILSITWLACETNAVVQWLEHSLALPVFGVEMKTDLFLSCGHCQVFPSCWHIECSTLTAPSVRIWNSSAGIPSPPLALFVLLLPKVHLTLHSRMSGSRWVIIPSWLSGSSKSFLYSSVYSCLENAMAPHSSTLARKIPWTEEPGRLQSMGSHRVGHDWATSLYFFTFMHWRRKWQPTTVFLPGESQGWRSLLGCCLWGRKESDMTAGT